MDYEIEGLAETISTLAGLEEQILNEVIKATSKGAKRIQGQAKLLCSVDTGRLRNSIVTNQGIDEKGIWATVSTNVFYAPYIEFGTGQKGESSPSPPKSPKDISYRADWTGVKARPYLYPAFKTCERTVLDEIARAVQQAIIRR
jgi:HK97 gp10 family phage protein